MNILNARYERKTLQHNQVWFYFSIATLIYTLVFIWKFLSKISGFQSKADLKIENNNLEIYETKKVLGITTQNTILIPKTSIVAFEKGDTNNMSLILLGTAFMLYLVVFGLISIFVGLQIHAQTLMLHGFLLILLGIIIDISSFFIHLKFIKTNRFSIYLKNGNILTWFDIPEQSFSQLDDFIKQINI